MSEISLVSRGCRAVPFSTVLWVSMKSTRGPSYSRTFYLRIRLFTSTKSVQTNNFQVKTGLFICEFKIRGPKWRSLSTANNEVNLYVKNEGHKYVLSFTIAISSGLCLHTISSFFFLLSKIAEPFFAKRFFFSTFFNFLHKLFSLFVTFCLTNQFCLCYNSLFFPSGFFSLRLKKWLDKKAL